MIIVVFNLKKDAALFCKRQKDPYKAAFNFVGGKVEPGEDSETAAYRELQEEKLLQRISIPEIQIPGKKPPILISPKETAN